MHVAEQVAVKAFLHLKQLTLAGQHLHIVKNFNTIEVLEMNVSTASSNYLV